VPDIALIASTALAAASAAAAWRSSFIAREAATRNNLAFVWPVVRIKSDGPHTVVFVRLHNDGPGLAQDVVAARYEPSGEDGKEWAVQDRTPVVRALRTGESLPPAEGNDGMALGVHVWGDDVWAVAVRWTDTAGQRWELLAPQDPEALTSSPRRLRRAGWQRWRPSGDW
jgi:hypothetical protein